MVESLQVVTGKTWAAVFVSVGVVPKVGGEGAVSRVYDKPVS